MDIITIGHSTLDYFLRLDEAVLTCDIDRNKRLLCLEYADKIPVTSWVEAVGGNAANSAIGLARLGLKAAVITSIGDDKEGQMIVRALGSNGVNTDWVEIEKGGTTDESVILNYQGERTILAYHLPREYHLPRNPPLADGTNWVYLTSLNEKFGVLHQELLKWLEIHPEIKLAYNPGMHELKAGIDKNQEILQNCEVLILNKEEAFEFLNNLTIQQFNNDKIKDILRGLRKIGSKIVIVTDGKNGTYSFDGKEFLFCDIFPAERVEMTGAGDSFSAGFLAGLISGKNIAEAMRWGNANSASVIQKIGSQAGLLIRKELDIILEENKNVRAVEG